jgi:hypothetical protein
MGYFGRNRKTPACAGVFFSGATSIVENWVGKFGTFGRFLFGGEVVCFVRDVRWEGDLYVGLGIDMKIRGFAWLRLTVGSVYTDGADWRL